MGFRFVDMPRVSNVVSDPAYRDTPLEMKYGRFPRWLALSTQRPATTALTGNGAPVLNGKLSERQPITPVIAPLQYRFTVWIVNTHCRSSTKILSVLYTYVNNIENIGKM
jgi:hypothetical protein